MSRKYNSERLLILLFFCSVPEPRATQSEAEEMNLLESESLFRFGLACNSWLVMLKAWNLKELTAKPPKPALPDCQVSSLLARLLAAKMHKIKSNSLAGFNSIWKRIPLLWKYRLR